MNWETFEPVCDGVSQDVIARQGEAANWEALDWRRPLPARGNSAARLRQEVGNLKRLGQWPSRGIARSRPASAPSASAAFVASRSTLRSQALEGTAAALAGRPLDVAVDALRSHASKREEILRSMGIEQQPDSVERREPSNGYDDAAAVDVPDDTLPGSFRLQELRPEREKQRWYPSEVPKNPPSESSRIRRPRSAPSLLAVAAKGEEAVQRLAPHQRMKLKSMQIRDATALSWYNPSSLKYDMEPEAAPKKTQVRQTKATLGRQAMRQAFRQHTNHSDFHRGRARGRSYSFGASTRPSAAASMATSQGTCKRSQDEHSDDPYARWGFELAGTGLGIGERCSMVR